jgi:hypothetical protein
LAKYPTIPERLQAIDFLTSLDHHHVYEADDCYFLWERISGASFEASATNDLIANLQIPVTSSTGRLYWKGQAIQYSAGAIRQLIPDDWRQDSTFVPVPPSCVKEDPEHDSRIFRVLRMAGGLDVRELIIQTANTVAKAKNIPPEERAEHYEIDEDCADPEPDHIVIFDDVVAGGSHFKAMKTVLEERFPNAGISGLFLARSIRPNAEIEIEADEDEEEG